MERHFHLEKMEFICVLSVHFFTMHPFGCVPFLQAVGWSSCWFSVGSSCPGPAPITASATPHQVPSPVRHTTSLRSLKASLRTANVYFYKTTRSTVYYVATSARRRSSSGSTPTTSPTSSPPPSTVSLCSRTWTWETIATCARWLKTPFTG